LIRYQVACIHALTSRHVPSERAEALRLLASAPKGGFGADLMERDPDLAPLRDDPGFRDLMGLALALRRAG
jgi:hypothetical protein